MLTNVCKTNHLYEYTYIYIHFEHIYKVYKTLHIYLQYKFSKIQIIQNKNS